jgi:hypothetical protein
VTDRREQSGQLNIEAAIEEAEQGFADWGVFDDDEEEAAVFSGQAAPDPRRQEILSPNGRKAEQNDGRTCPKCGELRKIEDFAPDPTKASGRKSHCKPCDNAKSRRYYQANRERVIARISARNRRLSQ